MTPVFHASEEYTQIGRKLFKVFWVLVYKDVRTKITTKEEHLIHHSPDLLLSI